MSEDVVERARRGVLPPRFSIRVETLRLEPSIVLKATCSRHSTWWSVSGTPDFVFESARIHAVEDVLELTKDSRFA